MADDLKKALAQDRFNKEFGGILKPSVQPPEPPPEPEIPKAEPDSKPKKSSSLHKFVEVEKGECIGEIRNMIQAQVDDRMRETQNEQFDIEWDDRNKERDLNDWVDVLGKFGRNTREIHQKLDTLRTASGQKKTR